MIVFSLRAFAFAPALPTGGAATAFAEAFSELAPAAAFLASEIVIIRVNSHLRHTAAAFLEKVFFELESKVQAPRGRLFAYQSKQNSFQKGPA